MTSRPLARDMQLPTVGGPRQHDPSPPSLPIIRLIEHIASSFPIPIVGFGSELAAQSSQADQQLTLTHPRG